MTSEQVLEIRVCQNPGCGLRYPSTSGQPFGERCPRCLGATRIVFLRRSQPEIGHRRAPPRSGSSVLLDNIRSAWNVGSMLRSADGAGFSHAFLCGVTPTPDNPRVAKTALGAEELLAWSAHRDGAALAARLAAEAFHILALETAPPALPLWEVDLSQVLSERLVLVVGSERAGIDPGILELASGVVCIPMRGGKASLNAAVAFGIAAYQISEKLAGKMR